MSLWEVSADIVGGEVIVEEAQVETNLLKNWNVC